MRNENVLKKTGLIVLILGFMMVSMMFGSTAGKTKDKVKAKISGCQILPANNIWNTPVDTLPVHSNSATFINTIGANDNVHADFGSGLWNGGPIGIPFVTVPGSQPKVEVTFDYDDESDPGPYPVPPDAPIEGGSASDGDRHILILDKDNCMLYELYYAYPQGDGSWTAGSGAIYNLKSNALRPSGWTSADAAGLPILPGLVMYDEVASGEIDHALRFTVPQTRKAFVWPARHYASNLTGSQYPPMGQRFRLKASFDISGYSPKIQVILKALKKYGMILADNGSEWFISGVPDERWNNSQLHELDNVKGSDFEAVDVSSLMISPNSGEAKQSGAAAKTIEVTSPNGGEVWTVGSTKTIRWTSTGEVGNVKIELFKSGAAVSTISSSTANDGMYSWKLPVTLTTASNYKIKISEAGNAAVYDLGGKFTIKMASTGQPEISLNRTRLNFGARGSARITGKQKILIKNNGTGTLNWTVTVNRDWLKVSPLSGSERGVLTVSVDPSGLAAGSYSGQISVTDDNAVNSPQQVKVYLTVISTGQEQAPIGGFDTPIHNSTVMSSIPVTGWALDDVEVAWVKLYRQSGSALVYIGDGVFVEGARPDVESNYLTYPKSFMAGWGYMLLTNFLPGGGNGTFTLVAIAGDGAGHETTLGSKTIKVANDDAVKPFGAIDTPAQGGVIAGSQYVNFGWALTPQPNIIAKDGSTIDVYVDGKNVGHPVYNRYRSDIATLFPGYANSNGAVGYFYLDTTAYEDGVHTIAWSVTDNDGNSDGIGSRYFTIENTGSGRTSLQSIWNQSADSNPLPQFCDEPLVIRKGYDMLTLPETVFPDENGQYHIYITELERLEIQFFPQKMDRSFNVDMNHIQLLTPPVTGSSLDRDRGKFYWQPGPGFLGQHRLEFAVGQVEHQVFRQSVIVHILPHHSH